MARKRARRVRPGGPEPGGDVLIENTPVAFDDAAWSQFLQDKGGYSAEAAEQAARIVLPDILRYDRRKPVGYPNGRAMTDDTFSLRFAWMSDGKIPPQGLKPHSDLLAEFPYLGPPHNVTKEESMSAVKRDDARRVISAAEKKAREIGQPMNIAAADEGGVQSTLIETGD